MHCRHAAAGRLELGASSHSQSRGVVAAAARVHGVQCIWGEDKLRIEITSRDIKLWQRVS